MYFRCVLVRLHIRNAFSFLSDRQLRYQHGHGPCNIFILDTSSSLGEDGFKEMKETFISIIDGTKILPKNQNFIKTRGLHVLLVTCVTETLY